ncbi:hypothetical protein AGRO_5154 [Agrobacterium sp. ATCC 31749]|uniref:hypothetical protein n=1 Tax=Agrobacterium sp. ATCC 31749 TaxID=82789 RepID=UPI00020DBD55|nr:hypothetical protein [Agrobacterium sp. ATCC 31749]EGL62135.1 hypothetical protein AGRO_5154 [Agrobacterium sp. ATCC 31749]
MERFLLKGNHPLGVILGLVPLLSGLNFRAGRSPLKSVMKGEHSLNVILGLVPRI